MHTNLDMIIYMLCSYKALCTMNNASISNGDINLEAQDAIICNLNIEQMLEDPCFYLDLENFVSEQLESTEEFSSIVGIESSTHTVNNEGLSNTRMPNTLFPPCKPAQTEEYKVILGELNKLSQLTIHTEHNTINEKNHEKKTESTGDCCPSARSILRDYLQPKPLISIGKEVIQNTKVIAVEKGRLNSTKRKNISAFFANNQPFNIVKDVCVNIIYYRFNLCYCFSVHLKKRGKGKVITPTMFLDKFTKICCDFGSTPYYDQRKSTEENICGVELKQLKLDEKKIRANKEFSTGSLINEICRIRQYNARLQNNKKKKLQNTCYELFEQDLKNLLGNHFLPARYIDMFLSILNPLYDLSTIFDRPQNRLLHKFLKTANQEDAGVCLYNQKTDKHHLFYWVFYWIFYFSNCKSIGRASKSTHNSCRIIQNSNFFTQSIIIIHCLHNCKNSKLNVYGENEMFIKQLQKNISSFLFTTPSNSKDPFLVAFVTRLFCAIKKTFAIQLTSNHTIHALRVQRTSIENRNLAASLNTKIRNRLFRLLEIGEQLYKKTANEMQHK